MAGKAQPVPKPRIGRTHPNFRGDNGKLAELVASMIVLHKCRPDCPCSNLQHLQVVARERAAHDKACQKYVANHRRKVRESRRNWRNRHLERERTRGREYQRKWRAGEVGNYDHEAVKKKNREDIKAKRHAEPEAYHKYRREYYAANRDKILVKRREKEDHLPREQYLKILRSARTLAKAGGLIAAPKSQNKGGRPKGMSERRVLEAQALERYIQEFNDREGTKKGAIPYAARKVYGYASRQAVDQARQTLKLFRK